MGEALPLASCETLRVKESGESSIPTGENPAVLAAGRVASLQSSATLAGVAAADHFSMEPATDPPR
jgi:hypothetical protein